MEENGIKNYDILKEEFEEHRKSKSEKEIVSWLNHKVQTIYDEGYTGQPLTGLLLYRMLGGFDYGKI